MQFSRSKGMILYGLMLIFIIVHNVALTQVVELSWSPNTEKDLFCYVIYRDTLPHPQTEIARVYPSDAVFFDKDVRPGRFYYYQVSTLDSAHNHSPLSEEIRIFVEEIATEVDAVDLGYTIHENQVYLNWQMHSPLAVAGFEVQTSTDRQHFHEIGFVKSNLPQPQYAFPTKPPRSQVVHYRLKILKSDGTNTFSEIISIAPRAPEEFKLVQNYPNPFNPVTTIHYTLAQPGKVTLAIFDLQGRRVKTLVDAEQPAGYYFFQWDATDAQAQPVGSGIYFYRLIGNSQHLTRKLILMK